MTSWINESAPGDYGTMKSDKVTEPFKTHSNLISTCKVTK